MPKFSRFNIIIGALPLLLNSLPVIAQNQENHGNWFPFGEKQATPVSHYDKPAKFPISNIGKLNNGNSVKLSAKELAKLERIIDLLKAVNPKPHLHSNLIRVFPIGSLKLTQQEIDSRKYRFAYGIEIGAISFWAQEAKPFPKLDLSGSMESTIRQSYTPGLMAININSIPDFLGGSNGAFPHDYEGPQFRLEEDFTYFEVLPSQQNGKIKKDARNLNLGHIVSIVSRDETFDEAQKLLGAQYNVPKLIMEKVPQEYFVYRKFSSSSLFVNGPYRFTGNGPNANDKIKQHQIDNMIIISHNNKLPFIPIPIGKYIEIIEQIEKEKFDRQIWSMKNSSDFEKKYAYYEKEIERFRADRDKNLEFISALRNANLSRLNQDAIVALQYSNLFENKNHYTIMGSLTNLKTGKQDKIDAKLLSDFFVSDPKMGKAYYHYDKEFYSNMSDGEIRTIALVWREFARIPNNEKYGRGIEIAKDRLDFQMTNDNPDYYHNKFHKSFNWQKLETVLGK